MRTTYTLLRINGNWYRAEVFPDGSICTSEAFNSMAQAARFIRSFRNFGYCRQDTMRYW